MNQLEGAVVPSRSSARSLYRRARLNHWLQRKAAAASLCYRALSFYDYTKAYHLLAELELPGPDYLDFNTIAAAKAEAFNLIPNQWEQVRLLLPGKG